MRLVLRAWADSLSDSRESFPSWTEKSARHPRCPAAHPTRGQGAASNRKHFARGYKFRRCFRSSRLDSPLEKCGLVRPRNAKSLVHWRSVRSTFVGQRKNSLRRVLPGGTEAYLS